MADIPDNVWQAYGIPPPGAPPPIDASMAGDPYGGLHPAVAAAYGLAPPPLPPDPGPVPGAPGAELASPAPVGPAGIPDTTAIAPPTPKALPSAIPEVPSAGPEPGKDFSVPPGQFGKQQAPQGGHPAPAKPAGAANLPSTDQQMANAISARHAAEQGTESAVQQGYEAERPKLAEDVAIATADAARIKAGNEQLKQIADTAAKSNAESKAKIQDADKAIDTFKIDRDKYWNDAGIGTHIGWYIATAMTQLGMALQHNNGPNPVVQMLQDKIKSGVDAQMDQREKLKEKRARLGQEQTENAQGFSSDIAERTRLLAVGDKMAAKEFELAAAKVADPVHRAAAAKEAFALRENAAKLDEASVKQQQDHDIQKQQVAISKQQVGIAGGHLDVARQAERRAQKLQDLEWGPGGFKEQELGIKAAAEQRKAFAEQQKRVKDEGIGNPITGDALLTERGRSLMAQADQLEAVARQDPARAASAYVQRLRSEAATPQAKAQVDQIEQRIKSDPAVAQDVAQGYGAQLRQEAKTTEVATISDPVARREVQDGIRWGQDLINTTSKISAFLRSDPDITDREGWAKLQGQYGTAMVEYAKSVGANASSRELDAISKHILTYDPNSMIDRTFRKAPAASALDGVQEAVKGGVDSLLKSHRIKDGWVPSSPLDQPAATFGDKTALETADAAKPGIISKTRDAIKADADALNQTINPFARGDASWERWQGVANGQEQRAFEAAASTTNYGLNPKTEAQASALIAQAGSAGNAKRDQIIKSLAAPIVANDRPSLAWGLLNMVRDQDPAMFEDILQEVGPERAKQIRAFAPPPVAQVPPGGLKPAAMSPEASAAWKRQTGAE